jgi:addiction module HigA family antidote
MRTTSESKPKFHTPLSTGEINLEVLLIPLGMTPAQLAGAIALPCEQVDEIIAATRAVTPEIAERLARFSRTSPLFWLRLQAQYTRESTTRPGRRPRKAARDVKIPASSRKAK